MNVANADDNRGCASSADSGSVPSRRSNTSPAKTTTAGPLHSSIARATERQTGKLYRFRSDLLPFHGLRTLAALPAGESVPDTLTIQVPANAAPGRYALKLALVEQPFLPNLRMRDLLRDEDRWDGPVIGEVTVR